MRYLFFALLVVFSLFAESATKELLTTHDVYSVMEDIFDRHVDKKEMSIDILGQALSIYVGQADPKKIYYLQGEVEPYLSPSNEQLSSYLADYQKGKLTVFNDLERLTQQAIQRSQKVRAALEKDPKRLLELKASASPYDAFAATENELEKRIEADMVGYLSFQKARYGDQAVASRLQHILNLYERGQSTIESTYMNGNEQGVRFSDQEREHQQALHILKAMARSLDSHTKFFDGEEANSMRSRLLKGYVGTGLVLDEGLDGVVVEKLVKDSPASRDGKIREGDILTEVNGTKVAEEPLKKVAELLEGEEGSVIKLTFKRKDTGTSFETSLRLENLMLDEDRVDVRSEKVEGGIIGIIELHAFYNNGSDISSEKDIRLALEKLRQEGPLKGLVLDLRNNAGGYLSEAVKVAGLFITNGVIVISKYHDGEKHFYRDIDGKTYYDGPLVVLISRMTASAAEIVAQALQDYGVAVVVGDDRSFGKGSIQSQNITSSNQASLFKVTVGKYYTVSGKTPQLDGVKADIVVPSQRVYEEIGEKYLDDSLTPDRIEPSFQDRLSDITPEAKGWFVRYYLPTLQPRQTSWQAMLPTLRLDSKQRMSKYTKQEKRGFSDREQMKEAVNVVQDMIHMRSALNNYQVGSYE